MFGLGMLRLVLLNVCTVSVLSRDIDPSLALPHLPFFTIWNAPTDPCGLRYGVDLDLSVFDIIQNQGQAFMGDNITIFYSDKLGEYPRYGAHGEPVNGGVPQGGDLNHHLSKAKVDLQTDIPDPGFRGLAVIDWEEWRPVWERNWGSKQVYWQGSRDLVKAKHPTWTPAQVEAESKKQFQQAAQSFMEETVKLGHQERPGGLWGFYGFPCCYNYQYLSNDTYTGECPALEVQRNDKLSWMWSVSSALYPEIYLELALRGRGQAILQYSRHRVLEAMRVRPQTSSGLTPVFPYARIVYTFSMQFLSEDDLVHTVGESAALGAAGVVLWGDKTYAQNKQSCMAVRDYLDTTLGRYIVNVTEAAFLCSQNLCSSQGRCARTNATSSAYLHLDPAVWSIVPTAQTPAADSTRPSYVAHKSSDASPEKSDAFSHFKCQCFSGWEGERCQKPVPVKKAVPIKPAAHA